MYVFALQKNSSSSIQQHYTKMHCSRLAHHLRTLVARFCADFKFFKGTAASGPVVGIHA
jgi:hypothetical protein